MAAMAQKTDVQESAALSSGPEDRPESAGSSNLQSETVANEFKTFQILKEWPIITSTVKKTHNMYESLKSSNKIFNWSCGLAEKLVGALSERCSSVVPVLYPAMRIADLAGSQLAEQLQQKLPVVRQPPSQVSAAVKSGLSNIVAPLADKIEFIVTKGKKRTRNAAKRVVQMYRKLVLYLDKWMEEAENYINASNSKGIQAPQVQEQQSKGEAPQQLNAGSLRARAVSAAANVALFSVGASVSLTSRLPLVGALLGQTPASTPASSTSTSPLRQAELPSDSPTPADCVETGDQQGASQPVPESPASKESQTEK